MRTRMLTLDYDGEQVTFNVEGETGVGRAWCSWTATTTWRRAARGKRDGFTVAAFLMPADYDAAGGRRRGDPRPPHHQCRLSVPDLSRWSGTTRWLTTDEAHAAVSAQGPWCQRAKRPAGAGGVVSRRVSEILRPARVHRRRRTGVPGALLLPCGSSPQPRQQSAAPRRVARPAASTPSTSTCRSRGARLSRHCRWCAARIAGRSRRSSAPERRARQRDGLHGAVGRRRGASAHAGAARIPRPNEVLVFSPYLIHGGAFNQQTDRTRVSLEMRFWRVA